MNKNIKILPYEIFLEIFLFLKVKDVFNCFLVNKQFNEVDNKDFFWKSLFEIRFPLGCPKKFENIKKWKLQFKSLILFLNNINTKFSNIKAPFKCVHITMEINTYTKKIVFELVKKNGILFKFACFNFKDDKEIVLVAVKQNGWALQYASERLKGNKEVVLEAVKQRGLMLKYASIRLKNDKEIVLEAVKKNGYILEYASDRLKDDKEIVLEAVKNYGLALEDASDILKNNKEVILEAVKQNGWALQYASERLKNDKEVVLEAAKQIASLY
jgi:hypothetical protein